MKFTKEQALEELKAQLTKGGKTLHLSERTISESLDTLIPLSANDDTELADFANAMFPVFETTNKNMEKEKADFIKSYKPKTIKTEETKIEGDDPLLPIKEKLEKMEAALEQKRKEEAIAAMTKKVKTTLKSKGVKDDDWIDSLLPELNITEDFDVNAKVESYVKLYNKSHAAAPTIITPFSTTGASDDLSKLWDDVKPKKD